MSSPTAEPNSPLFRRGIDLFNKGEFFECHEVLEELWKNQPEPERQFTQGLIQVAVALHHLRAGNRTGARKLLTRGIARLRKFPADHGCIDTARLIRETEHILTTLDSTKLPFNPPTIDYVDT
ncbi:MAG TPA: DUF309 domain-containing protein [Candidatus Obscuribacterales bacterium]